jgi:ADP-ribosylglycohydrolase
MSKVTDTFLGFAIGDALGVPVEFLSRETIRQKPVMSMRSFGTHNQPAGTWSDDSSMAFCLAEALIPGYSLERVSENFVRWYADGYWSAHGQVFDIGIATSKCIHRLAKGISPLTSGNATEGDNGNGSLMRIIPLVFFLEKESIARRFEIVSEVSAITHAHIRSVISCFIYTEFAHELLRGTEKNVAYRNMQKKVVDFLQEHSICSDEELHKFHRILELPYGEYEIKPLLQCQEDEISSSGYVLDTLEASIWCFLKYDNYTEAVLKAVNLGSDTDTTGCVTGGLAGLYYGAENIPIEWQDALVRKSDIVDLSKRLAGSVKLKVVNQHEN